MLLRMSLQVCHAPARCLVLPHLTGEGVVRQRRELREPRRTAVGCAAAAGPRRSPRHA
ncbi:MAG: hypothetical protein HY691_08630 [Chloroflexi bacterium]|nr:hypothetical protein [Chloroflexota bacterium]